MLNKPTGDMLNAAGSATPQGLGTAAAGTSAAYSREDHVHAIPTLSGDVTNTGAAVTVAKLQNSPVAPTTPTSGQVLTWDGTQWAPAQGTGGGGGANGLTYYLRQDLAADAPTTNIPGTPKQLGRSGSATGTSITSGTLTSGQWTLLGGYVSEETPIDPASTSIPAGIWDFNLWAYGTANASAGTAMRAKVYTYDGTNAPTLIGTSGEQIINNVSAQFSLSVLVEQTTITLTTRIYVAVEVKASANNHTATLQFGDGQPSHVHTSLPLVGGTGLWKALAGVLQSPASLLVNADVDAAAGIAWSKIEPSYLGTTVKVVGRDALSIQDCINLCTDAFSDKNYTILIPPKQYTETLTLRSSVSLVGLTAAGSSQGVQIVGNHSWTGTGSTNQPNNNRIGLKDICFVSGGLTAATISCPNATYHSQLSLSGCVFSGPKNDGISTILVGDNVSCYLDNSKIQNAGTSAGTASNGLSITNGPTYLSNNTYFETYGRAIDIQPSATAFYASGSWTTSSTTVTVADTSVLGVGWTVTGTLLTGASSYIVSITNSTQFVLSATPTIAGPNYLQFACARIGNSNGTVYTLTTGTIAGLAVGMKVSGGGITGNTTTIASLSTGVVTLTSPLTPAVQTGITLTFGGSAYLEMHDTGLFSTKGAEVLRVQSGLVTANQSSFTNVATGGVGVGGNGINIAVPGAGLGLVNSAFIISDASAGMYVITGVSGSYAALSSISYSNSILKTYQTAINANVTVADYTARATSIENGGTGATNRQAALNALAGQQTNLRVLAGDGTNITLRLLAAADIPNLAASKITSGQLAVAQGGTGAATLTGLVKGTGTSALSAATSGTDYAPGTSALTTGIVKSTTTTGALSIAAAGTDYQAPIGTISGLVKGNGANALTAAVAADVATVLGSQTAGQVYAAPAAANGTPGFRALVGGDLPATFTQSQTFAAGTTTVAPFKFQAGVKLTAAVAHAMEWDGTNLYATSTTPTRRRVAYIDDIWTTVATPAPTGTVAFYAETQDVLYYQTAATGAWTLNITGTSAPVTLNTLMAIGQSRTVVLMVLQGATAYVPSIQIDGAAVTPKWGSEVSTGNASKTDMMSFTILKTAAATFTVFGSITKFA